MQTCKAHLCHLRGLHDPGCKHAGFHVSLACSPLFLLEFWYYATFSFLSAIISMHMQSAALIVYTYLIQALADPACWALENKTRFVWCWQCKGNYKITSCMQYSSTNSSNLNSFCFYPGVTLPCLHQAFYEQFDWPVGSRIPGFIQYTLVFVHYSQMVKVNW